MVMEVLMSRARRLRTLLLGATLLTVAGCGGSGSGVASTPTPASTPRLSNLLVAVAQSTEFKTTSDQVRIRFDAGTNKYEVMLPGDDWQTLVRASNRYDIRDSNGATVGSASFWGSDIYSYTGWALTNSGGQAFAYGLPTPQAGVPTTGSATYNAELNGSGGGYMIGGTARFEFDFAKGTLGGVMDPNLTDGGWGPTQLGRRDFVQTVYATGSQDFSGGLSLSGVSNGFFSGQFTGPHAQELMGSWTIPFGDPYDPGLTVVGTGSFVGKKTP